MKVIYLFLITAFLVLNGCASYDAAAPVRDINVHRVGKIQYHLVQPGETLYAIAWRYEKDYRRLVLLNNLPPPYQIKPGELIQLTGKPARKITAKTKHQTQVENISSTEPVAKVKRWLWPTKRHHVVRTFSSKNKGIDIVGNFNEPIFSVAKGKVVYAGNGIRGYGNLLIIKHNAIYLTAYAYNNRLLVKQGQLVKAGQKIALMGENNNLGRVALHFEIRRAGRAVNPMLVIYQSHFKMRSSVNQEFENYQ